MKGLHAVPGLERGWLSQMSFDLCVDVDPERIGCHGGVLRLECLNGLSSPYRSC